jgi:hypothetical protein
MEKLESTWMRSVRYVEHMEGRIKNDETDRVCRTHGEGWKDQRGIGIKKKSREKFILIYRFVAQEDLMMVNNELEKRCERKWP